VCHRACHRDDVAGEGGTIRGNVARHCGDLAAAPSVRAAEVSPAPLRAGTAHVCHPRRQRWRHDRRHRIGQEPQHMASRARRLRTIPWPASHRRRSRQTSRRPPSLLLSSTVYIKSCWTWRMQRPCSMGRAGACTASSLPHPIPWRCLRAWCLSHSHRAVCSLTGGTSRLRHETRYQLACVVVCRCAAKTIGRQSPRCP
jgi:hypothetical protein